MSDNVIAIGSDHAGYQLKMALISFLGERGYEVKDYGPTTEEAVDYPDFAHPVASYIEKSDSSLGILICGSANGVAMSANKHANIRAAICWNVELAELARQHNNANILCLPARFIDVNLAKSITETFLKQTFEGGRHARRVGKINC
ncbi:MAG: ribose 5-phosphate isomerase B [Cyclobacteriaceae bacterium]|nr:ribose 5-phosphate isomerase B [Cyclobacteriaceae bacterium]